MKLAASGPQVPPDAASSVARFLVGECFAVRRPFGAGAGTDAGEGEEDDAGVHYHVRFSGAATDDPHESVMTGAQMRHCHAQWRARHGLDGVGSSRVDAMHVMHLHNMDMDPTVDKP